MVKGVVGMKDMLKDGSVRAVPISHTSGASQISPRRMDSAVSAPELTFFSVMVLILPCLKRSGSCGPG